jgi:DNA-binding IclR family transcriptional regulator
VAHQHHPACFIHSQAAHAESHSPANPPVRPKQENQRLRYHARLAGAARRGLSRPQGFVEQAMSATAAAIIVGFIALFFAMNVISFGRLD